MNFDILKYRKKHPKKIGNEDIKTKALIVIEHIMLHSDEDGIIYQIAHVANGRCDNKHEDWLKELNDIYADLIKRGEA